MPQEAELELDINLHPETERKFTKLISVKDLRSKISALGKSDNGMNEEMPQILSEPKSDKRKPARKNKFKDGSSVMYKEALAGINTGTGEAPRTRLPWYEDASVLAMVGLGSVILAGLLTLLISLSIKH